MTQKDEITFTFVQRIPYKLIWQYKWRTEEIWLSIVPEVMQAYKDWKPLSVKDELLMAVRYLKNVLL